MKKLTLFLVAIFAMVNVANAQRAWAYDLGLTSESESYTFTFKAVTAANATLVFYQDGVEAGTLNLGSVAAGQNTITKTSAELLSAIQKSGDFTWGVKMTGDAIAEMKELTKDSETDFHFWMPTGVAVDNNPESPYFSQFYIASPRSGKMTEGGGSGIQHNAGVYVFDQTLKLLNETKQQGYLPSNVKSYVSGSNHMELHRIAVNPITHKVAFTHQSTSVTAAVWNMDPADMKATATNLIDGTDITKSNSLCFDENGVLYIANSTDKVVYTVKDGVANTFGTSAEFVQDRNAIASDGRGGLWIAQYRGQDIAEDGYARLMHFDAEGTLDYKVDKDTPHGFTGTAQRGAVAYNTKEDVLAFGANRYGNLYKVTYNVETGVPNLESIGKTPNIASNIDGLAFDYAGDLYVTSASVERLFKYEVPTTNNTCTTPAKKSQVITLVSATPEHTVTISVNGNGTVTGANTGTYLEGTELTLTATPAEHYEFTGWTGDVTSNENPLTITVDGNKNITANFEKQKHILTVFVNDENKGTIDVATGSYEYGTEVTLTATPKPGNKLLAWSNKATTPSITLTMDNNKAVSAYFVKEYATDPTFTIEKVWENTNVPAATANGFQGVGWDGKIYVKDRYNAAINVYTETGSELYAQLGATVTGLAGDQPIAVDDAGNLVVRSGSTNFYDSPTQVSIFRKNENTPEVIDFTLPATGRCDFISASGDIFGEKGGYVYFFCMNQTTVSRLHIKNGEYEGVDTIAIVAEEGKAASQSHVVVDIYGNIHTSSKGKNAYEYNITTLTTTADSYLGAATKKTPKSTIGGCTFELGGKELWAYVAGITNYSSEWELKNVTDGVLVSNEVLYATDDKTTVNSNTAANWLNVQVVNDKTAYIYQFCPTVAAAVWKVSLKENYIVSASATNGTVTGTGTYQEGATATLTATPNTGYKFVNWTKGGVEVSTEATYSFPVTENVELVANFEAIASKDPRAWAYDMKLGEEGDNYTFTFKATTAGQATITFNDKDGNALAQPAPQIMTAVAGENKFTIAKSAFAAGVDAFWSITMDGAPIEGVVEVTDQSRGIYDFYNMMGVVVDNDPNSDEFGKIYVQMALGGTTNDKAQTPGLFLFNQNLDVLNADPNVGIQPTLPSGYTLGGNRNRFHRLNINPISGDLVYSYNIANQPAVFAIDRENMTGEVSNLLAGVTGLYRTSAHCFDAEGTLYVMDIYPYSTTAYAQGWNSQGIIYKVVDGVATEIVRSEDWGNESITMASDGRGGLWVAQNRGQIDGYYQLAHINSNGDIDWAIYDDLGTYKASPATLGTSSLGWLGSSSRGALAYDAERNILAQGRNGKVELYTVSYEPTITLTPLHTIADANIGTNIDGLAFDYAGDLYVVNSSKEKFQKFTLPTADNICTVAAPALEAVRFTPVYTVNVESNNNEWGIANGGGTFEEGQNAIITAVAATNYKFVNWTKGGAEVSTENPYTFAVTESATYVANFVEKNQYTINVTIMDDAKMGTVEGAGTYYEGIEVTLTAKANAGYVFVNWSDDNTNESRTFTAGVDLPETLTANFKVAVPRAWAYDLRLDSVADPANYTFTFKTTSAGTATLIFKDEDGNIQNFGTHTATATEAGEQTITIAKTVFAAATKDIYWEVELAGEAIAKMAEITDPTRNIYDFYNMMGVVVDNDPNSEMFGKIYIQQSYNGAADGIADRSDTQTAGVFIYDQGLNELNNPANVGIKPQLPYTIGANRQVFKRITINPSNGDIAFCNNTTTDGGAYAVSRENLAGEAINLTKHISDIQKVNALCFDDEGNLYVVANVSTSGTPNGNIYQIKTDGTYTELTSKGGNLFYDQEIAMASDGRGGLWIAQNRWGTAAGTLFHVNVAENKIDFKVEADKEYSDWFAGANYRGAIAYDKQRDILAVHSQACASVFQVTYAADGVPSISKICQTPNLGRNELDGLAFDYAGDLYVVNSGTERFYKYVLPTNNNTCTVPAPESQIIMKEARYTVTVVADPAEMGTVTEGGEYKAGEKVTLTATANTDYRFVNWTIGSDVISTDASFEYTVPTENVTITAHFELKPLAMVGVVKRAVQIGESTVVLTHEANGTPHLYKVVDGELEAEISQEGVIARDPDNAGDYLSISDVAVTEDGKLVATNKIVCQSGDDKVDAGYKRGELRAYIWNDLAGAPSLWFTSKMSSNWFKAVQGHTIAYKGTSTNGTLFTTGVTATGVTFRYSVYNVIDGVYTEPAVNDSEHYHFIKGSAQTTDALGANYQLVASPLAATNWILDGELVEPFEIVDPLTFNTEVTANAPLAADLGKKYNGASVVTVGEQRLMVAPYADGGNVAGVKIIDITNGLATAQELETRNITTPQAATAAATAVEVDGTNLLITLVADATIYTFDVALESSVTIDENADNTTALGSYDGDVVTATVTRSFGPNKYLTLTLPFNMNATQIRNVFGNATVYALYNVVEYNAEEVHLQFSPVSTITAGTPYILATAASGYDAEDGFTIEGVAIDLSLKPVTSGDVTMVPVLDAGGTLDQSDEYFLSNNALYCAGPNHREIMGLRAYFKSASPLPIRARVVFQDNAATSIPMVETQPANQVRKVLKDGQLIIIRGEEMYNIQGQRME